MRRLIATAALVTGLALLPAAAAAQDHVIDESPDPQLLYVVSTTSGSVDGDVLSLDGVLSVVYFSDRPARIAGHLDIGAFTELWSSEPGGFVGVPPSAVLAMLSDANGDVVLELLDVSADSEGLYFDVEVLEGVLPEGSIGQPSEPVALNPFRADPERYDPAFGGWCAFGMTMDKRFRPDPMSFKVVDGKTFLFLKDIVTDARGLWTGGDEADLTRAATAAWARDGAAS
jgi:hypothetical protein